LLGAFLRPSVASVLCLSGALIVNAATALNASDRAPTSDPKRIQSIVDDLARCLELPATVIVAIAATNPLLVSVEPHADRSDIFVLTLEDGFLETLDDDGLRAVIAHELGHVWIFTHHPYLQTERLANSVALRVVSRESLASVYEKVWERTGTKGDIVSFLGK
jgi:peptidase M48-like protein